MSLLAIDTATEVLGVAVLSKDKVLAEITTQASLTHSTKLMPYIEEVMDMAKLFRNQLTGIAVSIGPGSFTGLRIGVTTAKMMAYALDVPLAGVPTLKALAYHYPLPGVSLIPIIDAQKGNVYTETLAWEQGELIEKQPLRVEKLDEIIISLKGSEQPIMLMGDAVRKIKSTIDLPPKINIAPVAQRMPRAALVGSLGQKMLTAGQAAEPMLLEPLYIRRSEAEVLWEKRRRSKA